MAHLRSLRHDLRFFSEARWKLCVVAICFLGELPWILLIDRPHIHRSIYGWNTLRVLIAHAFGSTAYSRNLFGWMADLDKIAPYAATVLILLLFARASRSLGPARMDADPSSARRANGESERLPLWVTGMGLLGAVLITVHYLTSSSGHYSDFQDKGLLDALGHLAAEGPALTWIALAMYRFTYLALAPVCYYLLFSTFSAALYFAVRRAHPIPGATHASGDSAAESARFLLIAAIPITVLFALHDVAARGLGLGNYSPGGIRRYILYILYSGFVAGLAATYWRLRRSGGSLLPATVRDAGNQASRIRNVLCVVPWALNLALLVGYPIQAQLPSAGSSHLNATINASAHFFAQDYHHLPGSTDRFDHLLELALFMDVKPELLSQFGNLDNPYGRALMIGGGTFLSLGISPREISQCVKDRERVLELLRQDKRRLLERFPMFTSNDEAEARFDRHLEDLATVWSRIVPEVLTDWASEGVIEKFLRTYESQYADVTSPLWNVVEQEVS